MGWEEEEWRGRVAYTPTLLSFKEWVGLWWGCLPLPRSGLLRRLDPLKERSEACEGGRGYGREGGAKVRKGGGKVREGGGKVREGGAMEGGAMVREGGAKVREGRLW